MREVVDGVIEIPIVYVNTYAVIVDDGVVLIDTGIPGRADKVTGAIKDARRRIGEVHTILFCPLLLIARLRQCRSEKGA